MNINRVISRCTRRALNTRRNEIIPKQRHDFFRITEMNQKICVFLHTSSVSVCDCHFFCIFGPFFSYSQFLLFRSYTFFLGTSTSSLQFNINDKLIPFKVEHTTEFFHSSKDSSSNSLCKKIAKKQKCQEFSAPDTKKKNHKLKNSIKPNQYWKYCGNLPYVNYGSSALADAVFSYIEYPLMILSSNNKTTLSNLSECINIHVRFYYCVCMYIYLSRWVGFAN